MRPDPSSAPAKRRIVTCPTCGGESLYSTDNPSRPFCSERCKNVDFGAWASESYRVAARPSAPDDEHGTGEFPGESGPGVLRRRL